MLSKILNKGYESTYCQLCKAEFALLYIFEDLENWKEFTNANDVQGVFA